MQEAEHSARDDGKRLLPALKGPSNIAQGNAWVCEWPDSMQALKGRNNYAVGWMCEQSRRDVRQEPRAQALGFEDAVGCGAPAGRKEHFAGSKPIYRPYGAELNGGIQIPGAHAPGYCRSPRRG